MYPLVSVVIPVYNVERYVTDAVNSIVDQTYRNIEILVVDDGSSDRTVEKVAQLEDPRLRLIRGEHNGFVNSLNMVIPTAAGDWIARMDGDDIAHPYRLERQMEFVRQHPDALMVSTTPSLITPGGFLVQPQMPSWMFDELTPYSITSGRAFFSDPGTIFNKRAAMDAGLYDADYQKKDTSLWYRLLCRGKGFTITPSSYFYRLRDDSMSALHMQEDYEWAGLRQRYDNEGFSQAFPDYHGPEPKLALKSRYFNTILISIAGRDWQSAWKYARLAWNLGPRDYLLLRRLLLDLMGRETLKFWRWDSTKIANAYVAYEPDDNFVAETLTRFGLKFRKSTRSDSSVEGIRC
jgi:glycosyltransferase involved in cell wall biosynthesis